MSSCLTSSTTPQSLMESDSQSQESTGCECYCKKPTNIGCFLLLFDIQLLFRYKHKDMGDLEKGLQESQDGRSRSRPNFQITSLSLLMLWKTNIRKHSLCFVVFCIYSHIAGWLWPTECSRWTATSALFLRSRSSLTGGILNQPFWNVHWYTR